MNEREWKEAAQELLDQIYYDLVVDRDYCAYKEKPAQTKELELRYYYAGRRTGAEDLLHDIEKRVAWLNVGLRFPPAERPRLRLVKSDRK